MSISRPSGRSSCGCGRGGRERRARKPLTRSLCAEQQRAALLLSGPQLAPPVCRDSALAEQRAVTPLCERPMLRAPQSRRSDPLSARAPTLKFWPQFGAETRKNSCVMKLTLRKGGNAAGRLEERANSNSSSNSNATARLKRKSRVWGQLAAPIVSRLSISGQTNSAPVRATPARFHYARIRGKLVRARARAANWGQTCVAPPRVQLCARFN